MKVTSFDAAPTPVLVEENVPQRQPGRGELLVQVYAAGVTELVMSRRNFLATAGVATVPLWLAPRRLFAQETTAQVSFDKPKGFEFRFAPIKQIKAGVLDIGYYEAGPSRLRRCGPLA